MKMGLAKNKLTNTKAFLCAVILAIPPSLLTYLLIDPSKSRKYRLLISAPVFATLVACIQGIAFALISDKALPTLVQWFQRWSHRTRNFLARMVLPRSPHAIPKGLEDFVGREEEMRLLNENLSDLTRSPFAVCFFGFGGVGKTRLLNECHRKIVDEQLSVTPLFGPVPRIAFGEYEGRAGETLVGYLCRLLNLPESDATDQFEKLEKLIPHLDNRVILMDEFPFDDPEFTSQFEWLLREIAGKTSYRVLFVTASRGEPALQTSVPAITKRLEGLERNQLRRYVENSLPGSSVAQEILSNFDEFYEFTKGNPQIAKLVLSNQESWENLRDLQGGDRIAGVYNLDKLLREVWEGIKDLQNREDLRTLTVASQLAVEWPERLAQLLLPNWPLTKRELQRKALLNSLPNRNYKIHDLLAEFVYNDIPDVGPYHRRLSQYYVEESSQSSSQEASASILAARHAVLARDIELLREIYPLLSQFLFGRGEVRTLEQILLDARSLIENSKDNAFVATTARDLAKARLNLGETAAALDDYERARAIFVSCNLLSDAEEGELLTGMADCYRLRGRVQDARHSFELAMNLFSQAGEEAKAIAAHIEFGHSYFLAGEIGSSLQVYNQILHQLDKRKWPKLTADLYYRRSKSHRLLGSYHLAIAEAQKAEKLYTEIGSEIGVGKSRWALAGVLRMQQFYDQALAECHQVKRIFDTTGYRAAIFLQHDYAEIYRAKRDFSKASEIYEMTMERTRSTGEQNRLAHSLLGIAETNRWAVQSNPDTEDQIVDIQLYNEASEIYEEMGVKWGMVVSLIGRSVARLQDWALAKKDLDAALEIIRSEPFPVEEQYIESILTDRKPILLPLNWL